MSNQLLALYFEGDIPTLGKQLQQELVCETDQEVTALVATLVSPDPSLHSLEEFYSLFSSRQHWDACCACAGGALATIWNSGNDLSLFSPWFVKSEELLQNNQPASALAKAFLLLQKGICEIAGPGNLKKGQESFERQMDEAEKADSPFLQVMGAAFKAYCYTWNGDLPSGERLLMDAIPLLPKAQSNPLALLQHQNSLALNYIIQGRAEEGVEILNQIISNPGFQALPPIIRIHTLSMLLDGLVVQGKLEETEEIADQIRGLAVPEQNNYFRGYLNFCLGISALLAQRPSKALAYMEEGDSRARKGHSKTSARMHAMLKGLILADLGKDTEALQHLEEWHLHWTAADYNLLAALGRLEAAHLHAQQGKLEKARKCWNQAHALVPPGEKMFHLYRPKKFYPTLMEKLFPQEPDRITECQHPVKIRTLGTFELEINGQTIFDRNWRGRQSKRLMKLLIAMGGSKVSAERVAEILWPDADGDKALNSLNVTLSRLRKIGLQKNQPSLLWLSMKHNKLSLVNGLCCTDVLMFHATIKESLKNGDNNEELMSVLEGYTGNFLPQDTQPAEIETFRTELLNLYINGVLKLAAQASSDDEISETAVCLEKATSHAPTNEILYAELIKLCLRQKKTSKAREVYHHACTTISSLLGTEPSPALESLAQQIKK